MSRPIFPRIVFFDDYPVFERSRLDILKTLRFNDVVQTGLVAVVLELAKQVQLVIFELLNSCIKRRDAVKHLVVLVLVVVLLGNYILHLLVKVLNLLLKRLISLQLCVEIFLDASVGGNCLQRKSLLPVFLDLQVLNFLYILLMDILKLLHHLFGFVLFRNKV